MRKPAEHIRMQPILPALGNFPVPPQSAEKELKQNLRHHSRETNGVKNGDYNEEINIKERKSYISINIICKE